MSHNNSNLIVKKPKIIRKKTVNPLNHESTVPTSNRILIPKILQDITNWLKEYNIKISADITWSDLTSHLSKLIVWGRKS